MEIKKENLIKFYLSHRLYIFPGIVALSSLILIIFVILPQTFKLIGNQKIEGDLFNKSKLLEAKAQVLENFDQNDLSKKVNSVLNIYPQDKDFGSSISLLQNISNQLGFSIVTLNLGNVSAKNAQSYALKMEVIGPKFLVPVLLNNIENANRILRVSSVEVSNKDTESADVSMGIEALYSSVPSTVGSVDSPLPVLSQKEEDLVAKLVSVAPATDFVSAQPSSVNTSAVPLGKSNPFE